MPVLDFVKITRSMSLLSLAFQNLRRKPYRAVVIAFAVSLATGSLFMATIILRGVQTSLEVGRARIGADMVVVPLGYDVPAQEAFISGQPTTFYMDAGIEDEIAALPGISQTSPQVFVQTLSNARCCIGEFFLIGFDPGTDFTISPWLSTHLAGETLEPHELIVGDRILLYEGDSATFYGTNFTVNGVLEKTGMGIDRTIYVPMQGLREMIKHSSVRAERILDISPAQISTVLVGVESGENVLDLAETIEDQVSGVKVITSSHLNQAVGRHLYGIRGITLGITISLWLMSLLTIGLVYSLIVNERKRELGLLRAMGARRRFIIWLVVGEASLLTGSGGLVGLFVSGILLASFSRLIQLRLHIPYLFPSWVELFSIELGLFLLALLVGAVASLQPALSSSKMDPYEAIRRGA